MTTYPRENLVRAAFGEASIGDGRTLVGYPIVFDTWTTINSYEGQFRERIAPGALTKTLRENAGSVKVLFNHGMDPQIGDKPLGRATVEQVDSRGLYVEVPLSDTSYNNDLIALMRDGALDGMSFRFSVVNEQWNEPRNGMPERTITELRLFEYGPVTFPAYEATTVGLRSATEFSCWRDLPSDKRSEIARLVGISFDLRTLDPEPATATPTEGRDASPEEPADGHSEAPTPSGTDRRETARAALRRERARQIGAIR